MILCLLILLSSAALIGCKKETRIELNEYNYEEYLAINVTYSELTLIRDTLAIETGDDYYFKTCLGTISIKPRKKCVFENCYVYLTVDIVGWYTFSSTSVPPDEPKPATALVALPYDGIAEATFSAVSGNSYKGLPTQYWDFPDSSFQDIRAKFTNGYAIKNGYVIL